MKIEMRISASLYYYDLIRQYILLHYPDAIIIEGINELTVKHSNCQGIYNLLQSKRIEFNIKNMEV